MENERLTNVFPARTYSGWTRAAPPLDSTVRRRFTLDIVRKRLRTTPKLFACVVLLLLSGCQFLWNAGNKGGLKRDVNELLSKANANTPSLNCHMVGTTRTGICEGEVLHSNIEAIVSALSLTETNSELKDNEFESWLRENVSSIEPGTRVFKSKRRETRLQLKNGSSFEYFLLIIEPNRKTRIQVSYAYG